MSKRSQIEIMGLLIIVILLILIGVIFVRFSLSEKPNTMAEIRTNIKITNLLTAITHTTLCGRYSFSDAIIYCYTTNNDDLCGQPSCTFIRTEIPKMIGLAVPNAEYQFIAAADTRNFINIGTCKQGKVADYKVHSGDILFTMKLRLCD